MNTLNLAKAGFETVWKRDETPSSIPRSEPFGRASGDAS
ncbi:hypothetical protein LptCag_2263 [Leptospirillum ferriphilum]|uniref:Uncharacterized protein n=1 Tax=Leptospirillum ferriphilum TaxID=178606 RepID=A0A094X8F8_9BACT|nr:hypothetical protein LptCag_2263 [Leptospirillum ferriphilum]